MLLLYENIHKKTYRMNHIDVLNDNLIFILPIFWFSIYNIRTLDKLECYNKRDGDGAL